MLSRKLTRSAGPRSPAGEWSPAGTAAPGCAWPVTWLAERRDRRRRRTDRR
jgi:hypothetical protein